MNLTAAYLRGRQALGRLRSVIVRPTGAGSGTVISRDVGEGVEVRDELGLAEYFQIRQTVLFKREVQMDLILDEWHQPETVSTTRFRNPRAMPGLLSVDNPPRRTFANLPAAQFEAWWPDDDSVQLGMIRTRDQRHFIHLPSEAPPPRSLAGLLRRIVDTYEAEEAAFWELQIRC